MLGEMAADVAAAVVVDGAAPADAVACGQGRCNN
jgi:hypothetical protein